MAFPIEILATDKDIIPLIESAIQPLNKIQNEFIFTIAVPRLLEEAYYFKQESYTLIEVFTWLRNYRTRAGGSKPYLILVTNGFLMGKRSNLFGSHKATEGLAVFTTDTFDPRFKQFLFDKIRFCRYYLTRYIISFVAPEISSHPTNNCMFDAKIDKQDILLSLATGRICPTCRQQLKESSACNIEVDRAIQALLDLVSNQHSRALVMKGGGVKGLALVGAIKELERYFTFDTFSGTSAGAIAATLLGAGYTPTELEDIFRKKNFKDFLDGYFKRGWNFCTKFALHSGDHIQVWLDKMLSQKLNHQVSEIKMKDLAKRTIIYACRINDGPLTFDSEAQRQEELASFATRCSMSIPFFFVPKRMADRKVFDGGLGNNFPLRRFIEENNKSLFIGIYLKSKTNPKGSLKDNLIDIVTDSDERSVVDQNIDKVVIIDPWPVKTKQFKLSVDEKEFLVMAGKVGALQYLSRHHKDFQISPEEVQKFSDELEEKRRLLQLSRWARWKHKKARKNNKGWLRWFKK